MLKYICISPNVLSSIATIAVMLGPLHSSVSFEAFQLNEVLEDIAHSDCRFGLRSFNYLALPSLEEISTILESSTIMKFMLQFLPSILNIGCHFSMENILM